MPEPVYPVEAERIDGGARLSCPACAHEWETVADVFQIMETLKHRSEVEVEGVVMEVQHMRCEQCRTALLPAGLFAELQARANTESEDEQGAGSFEGYESRVHCPLKNASNVRMYTPIS